MGCLGDPMDLKEKHERISPRNGTVPHFVPATRDRVFNIGDKIEVQICPNPSSYTDFFVYPFSEINEITHMEHLLARLVSLGSYRQRRNNLTDNYDEAARLCVVRHPITKKTMRGRVYTDDVDADGNVGIYFIDTGEKGMFPLVEVRQLPEQARGSPPLAIKCSLPVTLRPDYEDISTSTVMERFLRLNKKKIFANVFGIQKDGSHIVDLIIMTEGVTFCEALLRVNDVQFTPNTCPELKERIENGFIEKDGPAIPSVDKNACEPISFGARLKKHGFLSNTSSPSAALMMSNDDNNQNEGPDPVGIVEEEEHSLLKHLTPLPPIEGLIGKVCLFNRYIGMNSFVLVESNEGVHYWSKLESALANCAIDPLKFEGDEIPKKNEIVLVPVGDKGQKFRRGAVLSLKSSSTKPNQIMARVRLLELGTEQQILVNHLIKPNKQVMNVPLFTYFVKLCGVNDDIPILIEEFRTFRSRMNGLGTVSEVIYDPKVISLLPKVIMKEAPSGHSMAACMNRLGVWEWRQLFRAMYTTNVDIINAQLLKLPDHNHPYPTMDTYFLKSRITATMKKCIVDVCIQFSCQSTCGKYRTLFCVPNDPTITYQHRSLQSQLQLFFRRVQAPLMSDKQVKECSSLMSMRLEKDGEKKALITAKHAKFCSWHRVFYSSLEGGEPLLMCIDCLWHSSDFKELEIVALPLEFYKSCPLGLIVEISANSSKNVNPRNKIRILSPVPRMEGNFPVYPAIILDEI